MFEARATVRNPQGIHCRPSAVLVKAAKDYRGEILVSAPAGTCDLKSIMGLLALELAQGTELTIAVSGPDEQTFGRRLVALFERRFDFPPREEGQSTSDLIRSVGLESVRPPGGSDQ